MDTHPYWLITSELPRFPALDCHLTVDVAVIGGGITGITAAYLLKKAGLSVALLERSRCAGVDTGHTTAHLTQVTDLRLHRLVKTFGRDHARAVWEAGRAAIEQISALVSENGIECAFSRVPGYLHAPWEGDPDQGRHDLEEDSRLATELGFPAAFLDRVPLAGRIGVRFADQAKFHPLKYLERLLRSIPGNGSHVFEGCEVREIRGEPLTVAAGDHSVTCNYVVIATHVPLMGKAGFVSSILLQSKLASYSSYVIGARLPSGAAPEALFWDTGDPYRYLRIDRHPDHDYAIFGGEDHKTGQAPQAEACFRRLEDSLARILPGANVDHRWSGRIVETNDGLPYIGETAERQFVATGFGGNGMTFGTLAAIMATDAALGRMNPWRDLFEVDRKKFRGGTWDYLKENLDYPYYFFKDRLGKGEGAGLEDLKPGQGKVLRLGRERVAAYRSPEGKLTLLSPVCTHLGCLVRWNTAESTWVCPCHGSRFKATGEVLAGPAESPLKAIDRHGESGLRSEENAAAGGRGER